MFHHTVWYAAETYVNHLEVRASFDRLPYLSTPAAFYPHLWQPQGKTEMYKRLCQLCIRRVQKWQMPPSSHQVRCSVVPKLAIRHMYSFIFTVCWTTEFSTVSICTKHTFTTLRLSNQYAYKVLAEILLLGYIKITSHMKVDLPGVYVTHYVRRYVCIWGTLTGYDTL